MKKIILKNGQEIDISEKEFLGALESLSNSQGVFISRIQKFIGAFEISTIDPIAHQVDYGMPYKIFSEEEQKFKPGRFFIDNKNGDVISFPTEEGIEPHVIGKRDDLRDVLFSEDEYTDKIAQQSLKIFPNSLLVESRYKQLTEG